MASAERSFQVSVFALSHNIRNGGNTPENRQLPLRIISQTEANPSRFLYRNYILSTALESGWRKLGLDKTTVLDAEALAPKPEAVGLNVVTSGSKTEVRHLPLAA